MFLEQTIRRERSIKHAQELGFSLAEIQDLRSMQVDPQKDCSDVQRLAKAKIADMEKRVCILKSMKRVLTGLSELCPGCGPANECPILESVDSKKCAGPA